MDLFTPSSPRIYHPKAGTLQSTENKTWKAEKPEVKSTSSNCGRRPEAIQQAHGRGFQCRIHSGRESGKRCDAQSQKEERESQPRTSIPGRRGRPQRALTMEPKTWYSSKLFPDISEAHQGTFSPRSSPRQEHSIFYVPPDPLPT